MIGTIVNVIAIIIGSLIGILFNKFIPKRVKEIIFQALGLSTILIGMQLALKTENVLLVIFSLIIGGIIGELIHIEKKLKKFGISLKKKLKHKK